MDFRRVIRALAVVLAILAVGNGCATAPEILPPSCSRPAWLDGKFDPGAPGYVVTFTDAVNDIASTAQELAQKHAFELDSAYQGAVKGFAVKALTPRALAELRCDPRILGVSFNESIRMTSRAL